MNDRPQTFEASAFHPELPKGRGPGTARVEDAGLVFEPLAAGAADVVLPFDGLAVRLGGAGDRLLFFSHAGDDGISIYTADHAVMEDPRLAARPEIAAQLARVRGKKTRLRLGLAAVVAGLALAVLGLVLLKDPVVAFIADQVPASFEVRLGELFFSQIESSTTILTDDELDAELEALVAPLLAALPETGYPFRFHLAADPEMNAFAVPGGHVVLHSGLVLAAGSSEEVLGVLAHEIAHVTERHSLRQMVSAAGLFVVFQFFLGDLEGLAAVLADGGLRLLQLEHSRDHEREADRVGLGFLAAAEIDPRGLVTFFERLEAKQAEILGDAAAVQEKLSFLTTHPATAERIDNLKAEMETYPWSGETTSQDPGETTPSFDFTAFQERLRQQINGTKEE